jgi:zinc/manganese transport system substrate-binding protein
MRFPAPLVAVPVVALVLAGCAPTPAADDGVLRVVASTSVYGDIAATVAGDLAEVESIVTSTTQDPHSYEVTARDRLALESADLVVFNGGGYDPFIESVLAAMDTEPAHVSAVVVAGLVEDEADDDHADEDEHAEEDDHADEEGHDGHEHLEGVNEHVWYDLHIMGEVAHEIAHELGELDADNADAYETNADAFLADLESLEAELAALAEQADGLGVVITEPVPGYLLAEAGFENLTPEGFSEAIEEGSDVPPALLAATLAAVSDAALVTNNPQTGGPETTEVLAAAEEAGVPVVDFLELLPEGTSYVEWMRDNLAALSAELP